jgi:DNA polymerase V
MQSYNISIFVVMSSAPIIKSKELEVFLLEPQTKVALPVYVPKIQAGFPSPADDYREMPIDLNEYLIKNPASTFLIRVTGDSMEGAGLKENCLLIVDRSLTPKQNQIIVAVVNGEFTVKRYFKDKDGTILLKPENPKYEPINVAEGMEFLMWGVVTSVITETHVRPH